MGDDSDTVPSIWQRRGLLRAARGVAIQFQRDAPHWAGALPAVRRGSSLALGRCLLLLASFLAHVVPQATSLPIFKALPIFHLSLSELAGFSVLFSSQWGEIASHIAQCCLNELAGTATHTKQHVRLFIT